MNVETISIASLHADPANARTHGPRNVEAIKASLARFGQQKPIVIDENNVVRAGNGTLAAAKALAWTEIRCVRTALAGTEATAFAIADNRTAELAEWDDEVLSQLLSDPSIGDVGFAADEIEKLIADEEPSDPDASIGESFQVAVECRDEADQKQLFDRLTAEGYSCRLLTM
jgi:ParB-like chromosome segregation protein Spo0J